MPHYLLGYEPPRRNARRALPGAALTACLIVGSALMAAPAPPAVAAASTAPTQTARNAARLPPHIRLGDSERRQLRSLAAEALAGVARARVALHNHKPARALRDLAEVRTLTDLIRAARPTAEVDAMLHYLRQQQDLEDNQQALADLLPVYAALNAMEPSAPVHAARQRLDAAKQDLEQNSRDEAHKELDAMAQSLIIDGVDFPLHAATDALAKLTRKLRKGDDHLDDSALAPVEKNLLRIVQTASPAGTTSNT